MADMAAAGISGGCVFSAPPKEQNASFLGSATYEERIAELRGWCEGNEESIFPVLWIHPYEANVIDVIHRAAAAGVLAFKMICTDYFIYEERPMEVVREIARLGLPIIFHTGILWDGNTSSVYNRPLNWEPLLDVDGIRFSMGHCSWPWIDECIALYGKFLHASQTGKNVEMFFDITPGTPEIYRRELLTKLYTIGYNVGDNVMFGLDSYADAWNGDWAKKWLKIDGDILDELGVSRLYREKLYARNLLRFLGKERATVQIEAPETDNAHVWTAENPAVYQIIEKWYRKLGFPACYDEEFYEALHRIKISDAITVDTYDKRCKDGKRNLLSFLFMCEQVEQDYKKRGISQEILIDTLSDIVTWCINWSNVKGELYLGELEWLTRHMEGRLFRLGRLQFCMDKAAEEIPEYGVRKGDGVVEIHIPEGKRLTMEECRTSIDSARAFFDKYFPQFAYTIFTCHSWLLDDTLKEYLPAESAIVRFGDMFDKIKADQGWSIIRYLFAWNTTPLNLKYRHPTSSLAEKVQRDVLGGKKFYDVLGVIKK